MGTILASWTSAFVEYAASQGASKPALLEAAGLTKAQLEARDGRVTIAQNSAVWQLAERTLHDELLGLHFAKTLRSAEPFGLIGYLARAATTWHEALDVVERFHPLLGLTQATLTPLEGGALLRIATRSRPHRHVIEAVLAVLVRFSRATTADRVPPPREVRFAHAAGRQGATEHEHVFGCPVRFGADCDAVDWPNELLDAPLTGGGEQVRQYLGAVASTQQSTLGTGPELTIDLERVIEGQLPDRPSLERAAKALGVSSRTLQRRLGDEALTFHLVADRVRRALALRWLETESLPIDDVAARLGFADASAFRRAFRRWEAASPREFRRRTR